MTKCINYFLCYENLVTYGAMLTFGKTGCCTCRCYRCINYFGMSKSRNKLCLYKCFVTYRAVFSFCVSDFCTSRCDFRIDNYGVTKCVNYDCLAAELYITYGTVNYVIIRTSCCTCRCYVVFNNNVTFCMTKCVYNLL